MKTIASLSKSNYNKIENYNHQHNTTDLDIFDPEIAYSVVATIQKISAAGFQGVKIHFSEPDSTGNVRIQYFLNHSTIEGVVALGILNSMYDFVRPINSEKILKFIEDTYIASGRAAPILFDVWGGAQ